MILGEQFILIVSLFLKQTLRAILKPAEAGGIVSGRVIATYSPRGCTPLKMALRGY